MSQLTHSQAQLTHPPAQALHARVPRRLWLVAAALIVAAAIALFLVISASDEASQNSTPALSKTAPGVRFDGGPEEGTRSIVQHQSSVPGVRFDGGPDKDRAGRGDRASNQRLGSAGRAQITRHEGATAVAPSPPSERLRRRSLAPAAASSVS